MSAQPLDDLLLLANRPFLPALGLASAALLALCIVLLAIRSRGKAGPADSKLQAADGAVAAGAQGDSATDKPLVRILFGTQTGTAERFAKQLRTVLAQRYGDGTAFVTEDVEMYSGPERLPREQAVLFLMATYGDGEPTDNAADFYNWLTKAADDADNGIGDDALLKGLSYGVFGLGNRQYEHFAAVGKRIHKALAALGAAPLCRRGDGDDDEDIDADFDAWQADLLKVLDASPLVSLPQNGEAASDARRASISAEAVPAYEVEVLSGSAAREARRLLHGNGSGADSHNPYEARLAAVRELHQPGSERSCLHAELDISGSQVQYDTGDHVAVLPENGPEIVEAAAAALGLPLETVFNLRLPPGNPQQLSPPFPGPITLRSALARHADVLAPVHRGALEALAAFAADASEVVRLRRLASPAGKADFQAWAVAQGRTLLEVMQEFPSAKPPLGAFFGSIATLLQPRFYSISSSPKPHPRAIHITCSVVEERKGTGRLHKGVASTWLGRLPIGGEAVSHGFGRAVPQRVCLTLLRTGAKVPIFVRKSAFRLPPAMAAPLVMVGPGTGLAPFRGFLQERRAAAASGQALGPAVLFFGCRNARHDFIYESELREFESDGTLSRLVTAFSRDGPTKQYVQHRMDEHEEDVWRLLSERNGSLYVCGDAKHMARDVHRALIALAARRQGKGSAAAEAWVQALADAGRYQRDVW